MANRVDWNPRHSVGDATLDAQHQEILARCSALGDCLAGPDTDAEADLRFDQAFEELMALARAHFTADETLPAAQAYPDLPAWRNEIEEFDYLADEIVTTANFDRQELQTFLCLWWAGHVAGTAAEHRACLTGSPSAESP